MIQQLSEAILKSIAQLALKQDKKPEYLEARIYFAKRHNGKVYFVNHWLSLEQATKVLQAMR